MKWTFGLYVSMCYDGHPGVESSVIDRGWIKDQDELRDFIKFAVHHALIFATYEHHREDMRAAYWIGYHPSSAREGKKSAPSN